MLLLSIVIVTFSVFYINVLSDEGPEPDIYSTIVGKVEGIGDSTDAIDVVFEHRLIYHPLEIQNILPCLN